MIRPLLALVFIATAAPAFAQQPQKIPPFVIDARAAFTMLKDDALTEASFGATGDTLPGHGIGLVTGVQVYPLRTSGFAVGVGGELLLVSATRQNQDVTTGEPVGPEIARKFQSLSGQVSLNFGHRQGWSYLSGGTGPVAFDTYISGTVPDGPRTSTVNYGGGARWFNTNHLAFCLDLRFYLTKAAPATLVVGERGNIHVMVISAGIAIK